MKYKAIIFELEGVICQTDHVQYQAWKQVADKLGISFNETIYNRLRGIGLMESLDIILENWKGAPLLKEEKNKLAEEMSTIYKKLLYEISEKDLSREVKDALAHLRKRGLLLAIGSSGINTRFILGQLGLYNYFDAISDGNNILKSKPDPEVFIKAAEFLEMNPAQCLVVEASKSGIDAARAAGMDSAAIGDAFGYSEATYNLFTFAKLVQICFT